MGTKTLRFPRLCSGLLVLLFLTGCAVSQKSLPPPSNYPDSSPARVSSEYKKHREKGIASWYGDDFHGKKTSSGEIYDMYALTAAHRTLPLGTYVRVTNLRNGQQIVVKINDRGPFVKERIIDLSYRAAHDLGTVEAGTAPVEITSLAGVRTSGEFSVQVGAFEEKINAMALVKRLAAQYRNTYISVQKSSDTTLYRVRVARCKTLDEAREIEWKLVQNGYPEAIVVSR